MMMKMEYVGRVRKRDGKGDGGKETHKTHKEEKIEAAQRQQRKTSNKWV